MGTLKETNGGGWGWWRDKVIVPILIVSVTLAWTLGKTSAEQAKDIASNKAFAEREIKRLEDQATRDCAKFAEAVKDIRAELAAERKRREEDNEKLRNLCMDILREVRK